MRCFFLKEIIKREEVKDTLETINSQYGKTKKQKHRVCDNVQQPLQSDKYIEYRRDPPTS